MESSVTNTTEPIPAGSQSASNAIISDSQKQKEKRDGTTSSQQQMSGLQIFAFLIALFSGMKSDSGEGAASEDSLKSISSALGLNFKSFSHTVSDVRSGKTTILSAAASTLTQINPSKADFTKAEQAVAKYAESGNPLLEMIAKKESGGNYNIAYDGTAKGMTGNFTGMTVNQVLDWQKKHVNEGYKSSAVGKYQIISTTLAGLKADFAAKGENIGNKLFDEKMQDRLGEALMNRRGYQSYLSGKMTESTFMKNLSAEWAALPKDMSGAGTYDKDGLNKAHMDPATMLVAMRATKDSGYRSDLQTQFASGGKAENRPPASGTEAFTLAQSTGGTNESTKVSATTGFTIPPLTLRPPSAGAAV